jgi:hypothetical protein
VTEAAALLRQEQHRRYAASEKGRENWRRYAATEKGKASARATSRRWSVKNRASINERRRRDYQRQLDLATQLKLERGCVDCGYAKVGRALDFDHRVPEDKRFSIAKRYGKVSDETLLAEIAKCDVRCANCHREKVIA